jgi:hypothetical protein
MLKYSPEVPEPTIALYVCRDPPVFTTRVIRKDRLASIPFVIVVRTIREAIRSLSKILDMMVLVPNTDGVTGIDYGNIQRAGVFTLE